MESLMVIQTFRLFIKQWNFEISQILKMTEILIYTPFRSGIF